MSPKKARLYGALAATVVVVLGSLLGATGELALLTVLLLGPVVASFGVVLGSLLTIFRRTREFAVGFLIASAILIFVSAGVCVATLTLASVQI